MKLLLWLWRPRGRVLGAPDYALIGLAALLVVVGLEFLYSASFVTGLYYYDDAAYYLTRQLGALAIGLALLFLFAAVDYHVWARWSPLLLGLSIIGLLMVIFVGHGNYGAQRWIRIGSFGQIQPSEILKLALVLYISAWLAGRGERIRRFSAGVVPFVFLLGVIGALVMLQPDMGTTIVIAGTSFILLFVAGAALHHLILLGVSGVGVALILATSAGYRAGRLASFFDPWQDPSGQGFHIIQSLIAFGTGGLWGIGFGASRQKFFYVPGAHTDAIFAIIGEELGFIGCLVLIALFAGLAYRGLRIGWLAADRFGSLLAVGLTSWLVLQALVNAGGITKSIPFTGVPMPFVSYGGSSIMVSLAAIGILINISRQIPRESREA
jgi:cell division protein FtsW